MILRSTRIVTDPGLKEDLHSRYQRHALSVVRPLPGSLAMRLWQDIDSPHVYFIHSIWGNILQLEAVFQSQAYEQMSEKAQEVMIERLKSWNWQLIHADPRPLIPVDIQSCVMRNVILQVAPENTKTVLDLINGFISNFLRQQEGCVQVELFQHAQRPQEFGVFMLWTSMPLLETWLASDVSTNTRTEVIAWLTERPQYFNLRLLSDDDRQPICFQAAKSGS